LAFTKEILKNSPGGHQSSPGYVLTFLRWSNRDTFNYSEAEVGSNQDLRSPFVVVNDAISVLVNNSKSQTNPTAQFVLKGGDINYSAALHPGDFVLVNMLNWKTDAERVRTRAQKGQSINNYDDGFKGIFKIQNVVRNIKTNQKTGAKSLTYSITAAGFTELNNVMYYNPALVAAFQETGSLLYQMVIDQRWESTIKKVSNLSDIYPILFKILLGETRNAANVGKGADFGNKQFLIPAMVGGMLGVKGAKYVSDIYNFIIGVWKDSTNAKTISAGFNPSINLGSGEKNVYDTGVKLQGNKLITLDNWQQVTAWSILGGYLNPAINEMYTTYRVAPNGQVMPTIVVRQKPFTSDHFKFKDTALTLPLSRHLAQPRWKVNAEMVFSAQFGRSDAARFNFVQVFSTSLPTTKNLDYTQQIALGNFVQDGKDIERYGLKPYIARGNYDDPTGSRDGGGSLDDNKRLRAKEWAQMCSDWVINGHLREGGTIELYGVQDPISVGDNFEFDGIIYHIESVSDSMVIMGDKKVFRTTLRLSFGMDARSSVVGPVYPQMQTPDAFADRKEDWENERLLPGVSDTQDLPNSKTRELGEEIKNTPNAPFTPGTYRVGKRNKSSTPKAVTDVNKTRKK